MDYIYIWIIYGLCIGIICGLYIGIIYTTHLARIILPCFLGDYIGIV